MVPFVSNAVVNLTKQGKSVPWSDLRVAFSTSDFSLSGNGNGAQAIGRSNVVAMVLGALEQTQSMHHVERTYYQTETVAYRHKSKDSFPGFGMSFTTPGLLSCVFNCAQLGSEGTANVSPFHTERGGSGQVLGQQGWFIIVTTE
jgi:hypothetical protein